MQLSQLANNYVNGYKPSAGVLHKHDILKKLRRNKNIVVLKPDKGNGVVILDRSDYSRKILEIIENTGKFVKLDNDPTIKR